MSEHVGFFQIWVMFVERWKKVTWSMLFLLNNRQQAGQLLGANPAYRVVTMSVIKVACTQFQCLPSPAQNLEKAESLVREAAALGANVILLQELFESYYFW